VYVSVCVSVCVCAREHVCIICVCVHVFACVNPHGSVTS